MISLAPLLQAFFTERLLEQRRVSAHTVAAYRDTFRLLLAFAKQRLRTTPSEIELENIDATLVTAFLAHLEKERGNSTRTRNARLAAIHSFFTYAAQCEPAASAHIQRVLSIPHKRHVRGTVGYLNSHEVDALLAVPDRKTWLGRRDHALLMLAIQAGLRVSELTQLRIDDAHLGAGAHVRCTGKGRKERCTPLLPSTVIALKEWIRASDVGPTGFLFPKRQGGPLSRDAIEWLLAKYVAIAAKTQPTLRRKRVSPHTLRHTSAMRLLHAGVDTSVIALWLGHESVETTQIYLHADMSVKERAIAKTAPLHSATRRYQPKDSLLTFLEGL